MVNRFEIGQVFGKWKIIGVPRKVSGYYKQTNYFYLCVCECGTKREVVEHALREGRTKSCGCSKGSFISKKRVVHGESRTRLYHVWRSMKQRCYYNKHVGYKNYGGRGITICNEWLTNSSSFFSWARANGYEDSLDIDRTDNEGNYQPDNCRFVTRKVNVNNRRKRTK